MSNSALGATQLFAPFLYIRFQMISNSIAPNCEVRSSPRAQLAPTNNPLFRGRVGPWGRCSDATETNMLQGMPWGAICVQSSDDSRNSAIRTAYRISLRSSSLREPRYPSLGVLFWLCCVAGRSGFEARRTPMVQSERFEGV